MSLTAFRNWALVVSALVLPAHAQITLTGAVWFASTPTGGTSVSQGYADGATNTLGGDQWWNLWFALDADGTSPINGPSDVQAPISIPLQKGRSYRYYLFNQGPCCTLGYSGLNLFFNGNGSAPGISVFGALNAASFLPNANSSTFSLPVSIAPGSGTGYYVSGGDVVIVSGYEWQSSGTLDVCQAFTFTPGSAPSATGSVILQVYPAATVSGSLPSAAPGTTITFTGSGFVPMEVVKIHVGGFGTTPVATAIADAAGNFTIGASVPQRPYGPEDVYAAGQTSGRLGATTVDLTPRLRISPSTGSPGGAATAQGLGFGAGETVNVYWGNPRQLLGTPPTNISGSFVGSGALHFMIPTNAAPGSNPVIAIGQTTGAIAIGKITVE